MVGDAKIGRLFVVSGASGSGKTTLCRALEKDLGIFFSVSATTRKKRAGEIEGRDYYFLTEEEFKKKVDRGEFLEWAWVHDNRYGTPRGPIQTRLEKGEDALLDLDTQGALQLKKINPDALLIFIMPPSLEDLRRRLENRGTDSTEVIEKRIQKARDEIALKSRYNYVVINEDLTSAESELKKILKTKGDSASD